MAVDPAQDTVLLAVSPPRSTRQPVSGLGHAQQASTSQEEEEEEEEEEAEASAQEPNVPLQQFTSDQPAGTAPAINALCSCVCCYLLQLSSCKSEMMLVTMRIQAS